MTYELYYWPGIPGRGEYPRLVLEAAETPYREMTQLPQSDGGGVEAMMGFLQGKRGQYVPFAPPFLKDGEILISQAGVIAAYLGEKLDLAPTTKADRHFARSIAMTTADFVAEVHDVHHPVGTGLYYEDQKPEARRRAKEFRQERIPKFLGWYETLISKNSSSFLLGDRMSYVDLGLFHTNEGLHYAFPRRMKALEGDYPGVMALAKAVRDIPAVSRYLQSERRQPFSENGIFRHYPELDDD